MRYLFGFLCVCALGMVPLIACSNDDSQCNMIDDTTCWCTKGGSCAFQCGEDIEGGCTLMCNPPWYEEIREQPCTLDAVNSCTMLCQFGLDCAATCGDDSLIVCSHTQGRCEASVGDNAGVDCEGAELCDIECRGSCAVTCEFGKCRVRCADPEECIVLCVLGEPPVEATLCPDGKTKVCAMECPADTLPARDVGAVEMEVAP